MNRRSLISILAGVIPAVAVRSAVAAPIAVNLPKVNLSDFTNLGIVPTARPDVPVMSFDGYNMRVPVMNIVVRRNALGVEQEYVDISGKTVHRQTLTK